MSVGVARNQGPEADTTHQGGEGRQGRPRLGPGDARILGIGHEMICEPEAVPTCRLGMAGDLQYFVEGLGGVGPDAESHVALLVVGRVRCSDSRTVNAALPLTQPRFRKRCDDLHAALDHLSQIESIHASRHPRPPTWLEGATTQKRLPAPRPKPD